MNKIESGKRLGFDFLLLISLSHKMKSVLVAYGVSTCLRRDLADNLVPTAFKRGWLADSKSDSPIIFLARTLQSNKLFSLFGEQLVNSLDNVNTVLSRKAMR